MIKLIVFDIDGVITDGTVIVDMNGTEQKKINLKDIDAIFELHREQFKLAADHRERIQKLSTILRSGSPGIISTVVPRKRRKFCRK